MIGEQLTQYFNVIISSPPESKGKKASFDVTKYIESSVKFSDEDGLIQEVSFDISQGYLLMDVLTIGMRIDLVGGSLAQNEKLFIGYIKTINPEFGANADVKLKIVAYSEEGKKLATLVRDIIYPSDTHPKSWGKVNLTYVDIIKNIAKDGGNKIGLVKTIKNVSVTRATPIKQHRETDYAFIQRLAKKINCTAWLDIKDGENVFNLVDNSLLVGKIADHTFYYPSRQFSLAFKDSNNKPLMAETEFVPIVKTPNKIAAFSVTVTLDTTTGSAGIFKQQTDKDGNSKIVVENKNEQGKDTDNPEGRWVLDEVKVRGLPEEERTKIIDLFVSGKVTWDGEGGTFAAKTYFKYEKYDASSREGQRTGTEVQTLKGDVKADGISATHSTTEKEGGKTYKTTIDDEALRKLSSEDRTSIMGRIVRGEITEADKKYYKVIETTANEGKEEQPNPKPTNTGAENAKGRHKKPKADAGTSTERQKRDAGFKVELKCLGDLDIKTKLSYIIEGLGKYSDKYYLYKIIHEWGTNGYYMTLTFVK